MEQILDLRIINFDTGGGSSVSNQVLLRGDRITKPANPARASFVFVSWLDKDGEEWNFDIAPDSSMTLYADWANSGISSNTVFVRFNSEPEIGFDNLYDALGFVNISGAGAYLIEIATDQSLAPSPFTASNAPGKDITLRARSSNVTVLLSANGSLFTLNSNINLTLSNGVTLRGRTGNTNAVVTVNIQGTLNMEGTAVITGNASSNSGGGVAVNNGGTFNMSGGTISGNSSNNSSGGVDVFNGTFNMSGGTINGNTAPSGGGLSCIGGTFSMTGGTINGNSTTTNGGGVFNSGTFNMSGGIINGNTAVISGGGVYILGAGIFTKTGGGTIYGQNGGANANTASSGNGHAAYHASTEPKTRTNTADTNQNMTTITQGTAGGWDEPAATYTGLNINLPATNNGTAETVNGGTFYGSGAAFTATVQGANNPNQEVTWSISGTVLNAATTINDGILNVAPADHGKLVTITAVSAVTDSIFNTVTVTIVDCLPSDFFGTWRKTTGIFQPYTITINITSLSMVDQDGDGVSYTNLQWTPARSSSAVYSGSHPNGYVFSGDKGFLGGSGDLYNNTNLGFIALSANREPPLTLHLARTITQQHTVPADTGTYVPIYEKQ